MKCRATFSESHVARSWVQTNVSVTAADTRRSNHSTNWSQTGPGSPSSIESSASRWIERMRSRRSCSMSAMRSVTPSFSVVCQREEIRRSSSARFFVASSCATISGVFSGFCSALSSESMASRTCSIVDSRSAAVDRRCSSSARPTMSLRRYPMSSGKPDSALSSRSEVSTAASRTCDETGNTVMSGSIFARCARFSASTCRHCG